MEQQEGQVGHERRHGRGSGRDIVHEPRELAGHCDRGTDRECEPCLADIPDAGAIGADSGKERGQRGEGQGGRGEGTRRGVPGRGQNLYKHERESGPEEGRDQVAPPLLSRADTEARAVRARIARQVRIHYLCHGQGIVVAQEERRRTVSTRELLAT